MSDVVPPVPLPVVPCEVVSPAVVSTVPGAFELLVSVEGEVDEDSELVLALWEGGVDEVDGEVPE